jgi:hypothetical protein
MASTPSARAADHLPSHAGFRLTASNFLRGAMEAGVLVLVCLSPWAFGSAGVEYESALYGGIALLLGLWAARILLERELS